MGLRHDSHVRKAFNHKMQSTMCRRRSIETEEQLTRTLNNYDRMLLTRSYFVIDELGKPGQSEESARAILGDFFRMAAKEAGNIKKSGVYKKLTAETTDSISEEPLVE